MKKVIFLTVIAAMSQMFCVNVLSQEITANKFLVKNTTGGSSGLINGGLLINANNNLEIFGYLGGDIEFRITDLGDALRLEKGESNSFRMNFPLTNKLTRFAAASGSSLAFSTGGRNTGTADLYINSSGNIGIGTNSPSEKLSVFGNIKLENNGRIVSGTNMEIQALNNNPISFIVGNISGMQVVNGAHFGGSYNQDVTMYFPQNAWNRIISEGSLVLTTGGRGKTTNETDLIINSAGNVGIGTSNPADKLTVEGNIRMNSGGKLIYANELELNTINKQPISFNIQGTKGFQVQKGWNNDMTLYFPIPNGNQWGRMVSQGALAITAGNRGLTNGLTDLYIADNTGNVGVGTSNPSEKLTVAGNIKLNNGKLFVNANNINSEILSHFSAFISGGVLSEDFALAPQSEWADHVFSNDYKLQNLNEVENYIKANNHLPNIPTAAEVKENGYSLHDMNVKLLQKVEELTLYSIEQNKEIEQLKKVVTSYESLLEKVNQLESKINQ